MKLLGKADTNWTQEGSFKAMSGFLAQHGSVDAVLFEYADGFRGGLRAYEAAKKAPDLIVSLRTDEMGVICDWEKANDPNFKIFYSNGQNDQARFALTAAMMKKEGKTYRRPSMSRSRCIRSSKANATRLFLKARR